MRGKKEDRLQFLIYSIADDRMTDEMYDVFSGQLAALLSAPVTSNNQTEYNFVHNSQAVNGTDHVGYT